MLTQFILHVTGLLALSVAINAAAQDCAALSSKAPVGVTLSSKHPTCFLQSHGENE